MPRSLVSFRLCWLVLFLLCVPALSTPARQAGTAARNPAWARPVPLPPVENFFEVAPGLYRSAQPSKKAMQALEKFGIRTIVNLRANHTDTDEARGTSLLLRRIPITTWNITDDQVIRVLTLIRTEPGPILVHCQHGADRTGLMIAAYRMVEQNWTKEAALEELKSGGYGFHAVWKNIPRYIEAMDIMRMRALVDAAALAAQRR